MQTFFPAALAKKNDPNYIFQSNNLSASAVAKANPGISKGKNQITMTDFDHYISTIVEKEIPDHFKPQFA